MFAPAVLQLVRVCKSLAQRGDASEYISHISIIVQDSGDAAMETLKRREWAYDVRCVRNENEIANWSASGLCLGPQVARFTSEEGLMEAKKSFWSHDHYLAPYLLTRMSPLGVAVRKGIPNKNPKGTIRAERENLRASTLQLLTDNDTLRASKVDMTATVQAFSEDKDALQVALKNATTDNQDLRALIETLNQKINDLKTSIEASDRAHEVEKADADKLKASNVSLSKANEDLEARLQRATPAKTCHAASTPSLANDTMNHLAAYNNERDMLVRDIGTHTRYVQKEQNKAIALKQCLEGIKADNAILNPSANNHVRSFALAAYNKAVAEAHLAHLRRALVQAQARNAALEREVAVHVQKRVKRVPQQ
ncbi:hypothetical protein LTR95_017327 [Oleoguttula sp. CCFEE 5521]